MAVKSIEVVAAVIETGGETLCVQRGESQLEYISKKWEFPGGKLEAGETQQEALAREIREELHMDIAVGELITTVRHRYPDFELIMHAYRCTVAAESHEVTLTEHLAHRWLPADSPAFRNLDWAAADVPIVEELARPMKEQTA
jgi:8-oxo-dGTP diphosphatase